MIRTLVLLTALLLLEGCQSAPEHKYGNWLSGAPAVLQQSKVDADSI